MAEKKKLTLERVLPWILVIGGTIGLIAAFVLTMEKLALYQNPSYQPSCNLNPVLSCGSIIKTDQASAFGFPNPFIGLASYAVLITTGMALLAGATFKRWYWRGLQAGATLGILFCLWLAYQSLYSIGALCLYCMIVWSITWPIFWYTTLYNLRHKHIPTPKSLEKVVNFMQRHHVDILVSFYVIIFLLIVENFWYYWSTLL